MALRLSARTFQQIAKPCQVFLASRHMHQAASKQTHHFVKKPITFEFQFHHIRIDTDDFDTLNGSGRIKWVLSPFCFFFTSTIGREPGEIVSPH